MARSKRQTQILTLSIMAGCAGLIALSLFVVLPMISELRSTRQKIENVQIRLSEVRRTVRERPSVRGEIEDVLEELRHLSAEIPIPVLGNYLIGMEESIRDCVDENAVRISAFLSAGEPGVIPGGSGLFKVFQTRVIATSGLHDLGRTFHDIERQLPYASISGVIINPQDNIPERHAVNFVLSWLIWADPDNRPLFEVERQ